ncbi:DUF2690 domain-containing protein [Nonomuraea monospora]
MSGTPAAASAAGCSWEGCNGLDPQAMGCNGSSTQTLDTIWPDRGGIKLELRYSPTCQAVWARYYNGINGNYGRAEIHGCGDNWCRIARKTIAGYAGETNWTTMLSWSYRVKACFWWDGFQDCTAEF